MARGERMKKTQMGGGLPDSAEEKYLSESDLGVETYSRRGVIFLLKGRTPENKLKRSIKK